MIYSIRIKIKSIRHYRDCCAALVECGVKLYSQDIDELTMYRTGEYGWLYIGINRVGWVFFSKSVVRYSKPVTIRKAVKLLRTKCSCGDKHG